jgi:hypothetical protein
VEEIYFSVGNLFSQGPSDDATGGIWMSPTHVYALANVLRRPIVLLNGAERGPNMMFLPDRHDPEACRLPNGQMPAPLIIAWQVRASARVHVIAVGRACIAVV